MATLKLELQVPEHTAEAIREAVDAKRFRSPAHVVQAALELWASTEGIEPDQAELAEMRAAWAEGIESGDAGPLNIREFIGAQRSTRRG